MSLEADTLMDRRRLKRRLAAWRLLAILFVIAIISLIFGEQLSANLETPHIAYIQISGLIVDNREVKGSLARIASDDDTKALLVHINSPGGTTMGGEELFHAIRGVSNNKPVVAVIGTLGTSAGYLVALAADHIVARTTSLTGSIGVLLETAEFSRLLDRIGISAETVKSGPWKGVPSLIKPLTEQDRAIVQSVVDDSHQWFIDLLANRRHLTRDEAQGLADGRVFTGRQALEVRLIDEIGGEDTARAWLAEVHGVSLSLPLRSVEITSGQNFLLRNILDWTGKTLLPERLRLDGLVSLWHPE